jgi:hypothetical protein
VPLQLRFSATPDVLSLAPGRTAGRVTLSWQVPGVSYVQVRVGSPYGPPLTGFESPIGSAETGDWVTDGMIFYLQNAGSGDSAGPANTIATVQMRAGVAGDTAARGFIASSPVIMVAPGVGRTTLSWLTRGVSSVQVRVNSPAGPPMTGFESPSGSASTGDWVTDGMTFYLQDASSGNSAGSSRTLAAVRVRVGR